VDGANFAFWEFLQPDYYTQTVGDSSLTSMTQWPTAFVAPSFGTYNYPATSAFIKNLYFVPSGQFPNTNLSPTFTIFYNPSTSAGHSGGFQICPGTADQSFNGTYGYMTLDWSYQGGGCPFGINEASTATIFLTGGNINLNGNATVNSSGLFTAYNNGTTLVDNGVPAEVAHINLTGQGAAIPTGTSLYATRNASYGAGQYRIAWDAKVTTAATTSSTLGGTAGMQITYTDADDGVTVSNTPCGVYNSTAAALNTTQAQISGACMVNAKQNTNIQYGFGYTSSGTTLMQYSLHVKVEQLQ
jgi:hypothetical protein